ncbi:hypothetical protein Pan97_01560 [Bremerella volcania]|uniref:Carboxypeptidase regulatory-like domain-containing protein n=1 Tax=Bremerella volcania TaxID=2527984 RepID=A0A518C1T5_9BACT|nr:carboxypeptidase-like regulatory domain-containing protein [Bremerella volcania]QDU73189.1 hypothetical protein Pan97_01560 [Bremerella volcania]
MNTRGLSLCLLLTISQLVGCGGSGNPIGTVNGKVTLNGEPVSEAYVMFEPVEGGRSSFGITDTDGNYQLTYMAENDGALVGEHTVRITTQRGAKRDDRGQITQPGVKEKFPPEYNTESTQQVTVESGRNEINFDVISDKK